MQGLLDQIRADIEDIGAAIPLPAVKGAPSKSDTVDKSGTADAACGWQCPRCLRVNGPHVDVCGCQPRLAVATWSYPNG